jgi:transposase
MKGRQQREDPLFACVRLEDLVPKNHMLRKVDKWIDLSVVHEKTEGLYSHTGRPSIDPEVPIRMMINGYLYGITSERRLCEEGPPIKETGKLSTWPANKMCSLSA